MGYNKYKEVQSFDDDNEVIIYTPASEHMKVVCHTTLIFDVTKCQKLHNGEPKEDVVQKEKR